MTQDTRHRIEAAIEALIGLLDALDSDTDAEPEQIEDDGTAEHWHQPAARPWRF